MRIRKIAVMGVSLAMLTACQEVLLENLAKDLGLGGLPLNQSAVLDDATIVKGLKEALAVGTERAVRLVAQPDGYFGNQLIKLLMPEKIRNVADLLGKVGFQRQVDQFVLSMNRAAEKAAPVAVEYFVGAIREMTFADARQILSGDATAATTYFRSKTAGRIHAAFKPTVVKSLDEVGATRAYKGMMTAYDAIPLTGKTSFDLDEYVTAKAVDGLFAMLAEEEKQIRANPAARTSELLRRVFGR